MVGYPSKLIYFLSCRLIKQLILYLTNYKVGRIVCDTELRESAKMLKDKEEMEDLGCKTKRIAYSFVVRTLDSGGRGNLYV